MTISSIKRENSVKKSQRPQGRVKSLSLTCYCFDPQFKDLRFIPFLSSTFICIFIENSFAAKKAAIQIFISANHNCISDKIL
jgi:hypothetical protein